MKDNNEIQYIDLSTEVCVNDIDFTNEESLEKYRNNFDKFDEDFLSKLGALMKEHGVGSINCGLSTFWIEGLDKLSI